MGHIRRKRAQRACDRCDIARILALLAVTAIWCAPAPGAPALVVLPQASSIPPQTAAPPGSLEASLDEALRAAGTNPDKSKMTAQDCLARARAAGDAHSEAYALTILGVVAQRQDEYVKARSLLEQALATFSARGEQLWIARVELHLGRVSSYQGKHEEAADEFQKALAGFKAVGDLVGQAWALREIGGHDDEVVELAFRVGDKPMQAAALHDLGDHLFSKGDFAAAEEKTEQAGHLYQEVGDGFGYARVLTSLGRLQRAHGRVHDAIPYYEKALQIQKDVKDRQGQLQSLNAIGVSYGLVAELETARKYYLQALELAQQIGSARYIDFIQGALAGNSLQRGDFANAEATLRAIIARRADPNLDFRYLKLSEVYLAEHRYQDAFAAANESVELGRSSASRNALPNSLGARAQAERHLGQSQRAQADLGEALDIVEQQRRHLVAADFMKNGYSDIYQFIFSAAVALHQQMGETGEAFQSAERARARSFIDLLATRDLQLERADTVADRSAGSTSGAVGASTAKTDANLAFRGVLSEASAPVNSRVPGAHLESFVSADPPTLDEVFSVARRLHSTILSYWVANEELFIWVVSPNGTIKSARVETRGKHIEDLVRAATALTGNSSAGPRQLLAARGGTVEMPPIRSEAWRELYDVLIAPVRAYLPAGSGSRLTIIPHGPLNALSFAALVTPTHRYLIEDYQIHYAPSAALLVRFSQKAKSAVHNADQGTPFLLVGDPEHTAQRGERVLPRLPGARDEVRAIATELSPQHAEVVTGASATEAAFRGMAGGKSILHLATHALINPQAPLDSYLLLAGDGSSSRNDGRLTAQEIYSLNLDADLVVLSACRTGSDFASLSDEGVAHLARAFFYAGSRSVMVTLWDVEDNSSSALLQDFYRHWPRAQNKSQALRRAQLNLIRQLRAGRVQAQTPAGAVTLPEHPYLWAGFVLLGEP
jgi:CHAT domain-containing protein/tetratricopeptide (TPR) repeat protein